MTKNTGAWTFVELEPNLFDLTYSVDVELSIWVPDVFLQSMVESKLPTMLQRAKERIEATV